MRVIADSSTLYSPQEGRGMGVTIVTPCVIAGDTVYKEYEEITGEEFLKLIEEGMIPTTSQPSIGDVLEVLEGNKEDVLYISIGDGLSGAYQNAMGARNCLEDNEHIHIVDSRTLAAAERYLLQKALKLKALGHGIHEILKQLQTSIDSSVSFVIPEDFQFLKRSGRLTPIAAKIGEMIRIVPVMTQTEDKKRIRPFAIKRTKKTAVDAIIGHLKELGVNEQWRISICHAGAVENANAVWKQIRKHFEHVEMEILPLAPTLMTHGGPGCVTIQAIQK